MKVLVATESRHGGTAELGRTIGQVLGEQGHYVVIRDLVDVESLDGFDAYVIGSAVYMGSWPHAARAFVERHREELAAKPTWLFSSGPLGSEGEVFADELVEMTRPRDHHVFGGRLDKSKLSLAERAFAGLLHVPDGDFREWEAAVAWATAIGRVLAENPQTPAART